MIKYLTVIGILIAVLSGGLTALSEPEPSAVRGEAAQEEPLPTAEPQPQATSTPEPVTNREDCDEIRGTEYLSRGERTWFLANCVRR